MKINIYTLLADAVLLSIFAFPVTMLTSMGIPLDKYFFMFWVLVLYAVLLMKNKFITLIELEVILISLVFSAAKADISFLHLISIALAYRIVRDDDLLAVISDHLHRTPTVYVCLAFVVFYSLVYFGDDGRYVRTGIQDPNTTGLAIFCLFVLIRCRHKLPGDFLLLCGILTFSRTYLAALAVFFLYNQLVVSGRGFTFNYVIISVVGILALVGVSSLFTALQERGEITDYASGFSHFSSVFDFSNYFRFIVNTNLINIYVQQPDLLLTGMTDEHFIELNRIYSRDNDLLFRMIKPHNYFFSYFQIYGIWCVSIFYLTYEVFKKLINKRTNGCAMVIFIYLMLLSLGAANYWLFLSMFLLMEVNRFYENTERHQGQAADRKIEAVYHPPAGRKI